MPSRIDEPPCRSRPRLTVPLGIQLGMWSRMEDGMALGTAMAIPTSRLSPIRPRTHVEICSIGTLFLVVRRLVLRTHFAERAAQHLDLHAVGDLDAQLRILLLRHFGDPANDP